MTVRWFVLAFCVAWLGPLSPRAPKEQIGTSNYVTLRVHSPARIDRTRTAAGSRAVIHCLFGPRFLFRNQKRLTPSGNVLFGGARPNSGAASRSIAAVTREP